MIKEMQIEPGEYKAGQAMVAVSRDELIRLRKIAACFQDGDADLLKWMHTGKGDEPESQIEIAIMLGRITKAAKLAEGGA